MTYPNSAVNPNDSMLDLLLGSETDDTLFDRLYSSVQSLGGSITDSGWALGGSQEITTYTIVLPTGSLEAIAETYIGLSLRGPTELVNSLASRVLG